MSEWKDIEEFKESTFHFEAQEHMRELTMIIQGDVPSKSNSYKIITLRYRDGRTIARLGKTSKLTEYERTFSLQCKGKGMHISEPFICEIDVFFGNRQKDIDNASKCILDCLTQNDVIKDDVLCYELTLHKHIDRKRPRINIRLTWQENLTEQMENTESTRR